MDGGLRRGEVKVSLEAENSSVKSLVPTLTLSDPRMPLCRAAPFCSQAYLSRRALPSVLRAMRRFPELKPRSPLVPDWARALAPWPGIQRSYPCGPEEAALQTKGLVLLGVLVEGSQPLHEAVRQRLLEEGVVDRVGTILLGMGGASDDILWACLFCMSGLCRQSPGLYSSPASLQARRRALRLGLLPLLRACIAGYQGRVAARSALPDELIQRAGEFMLEALERERVKRGQELGRVAGLAVVCGAAAAASVAALVWNQRDSNSSSSSDSSKHLVGGSVGAD